ncbi:MAG: Crp/Fnr family transcriptional regulator [Thermodesulfobacteriota bacterium]
MSPGEAALTLRALPLFKGLPERRLKLLEQGATVRAYAAGETILDERPAAGGLYVLLSGRAKLFRLWPDGREQILYFFGPGEPFCLCSMYEGRRAPANAAAVEASRVLVLEGRAFEAMARQEPAILFDILRVVSRRLKEAMDLVESLSFREIPGRVAMYLTHAEAAARDPDRIRLPLTHRELAKVVGASPEALSRAFRRLADDGLLTVKGRDVRILDRARLEAVAAGE